MAHRKVFSTGGRYGTRMMTAGEPMVLTGPAARAAIATGKATAHPVTGGFAPVGKPYRVGEVVSEQVVPKTAEAPADERPALRAAYETKFGKKPFGGWDAAKLREKLTADA